ncbi:MAG: ATP-binding cassette domain-containing protein [Anaerolineae bacterium]|nr:ATP-binding cassette domain-containing protein [Anaerolineae bacterium]
MKIHRMYLTFGLLGSLLVVLIAWPLLKTVLFSPPALLWQTLLEREVQEALLRTFSASFLATSLATVLGIPLAYLLARSDFPGKNLVEGIVNLPIVIPHSAVGLALLLAFGRPTLPGQVFERLGIRFVSAFPGIVLAMLFVGLTFLVNAAREGFESVDPRLEKIARTLGASPWQTFWQISLPLAWRSILSGMILTWARGLSEFGSIAILAYHPMVASVLLYERFESMGLARAQPVAAWLVLICLGVFVVLRLIGGRKEPQETPPPPLTDLPPSPSKERAVRLDKSAGGKNSPPSGPQGREEKNPPLSLLVRGLQVDAGNFSLHQVDLEIAAGEYFVLLGPTGAGKTVFLETVAGLRRPAQGYLYLGKREITRLPPEQRGVGFVYQNQSLFPHLTVAENIAFGLRLRGLPPGEVARQVEETAGALGIGHLLFRLPRTLSGGEAQRVALARALVLKPTLLLLDEPLSALDPGTREALQEELRRLHRERGTTTIHVTHNFEEAVSLGNRIAVLQLEEKEGRRWGRIVQVGTPEEIFRQPATPFVAQFVGAKNLFRGTALRAGEITWVEIEGGLQVAATSNREGPVHLMVRPEDILLSTVPVRSSARNCFRGRIVEIRDGGAILYVVVDVPPRFNVLITRLSREEMGLEPGMEVYLAFKASVVHLL